MVCRRAELLARLNALLGEAYVVDVDRDAVRPYVHKSFQGDLGTLLWLYFEGLVPGLQKFVKRYGESGKTCFNRVVAQHRITLSVNPAGDKSDTISAAIYHGVYHILFHPDRFGMPGVVPSMHQDSISILKLIDPIQMSMNVLNGHSLEAVHERSKPPPTWDRLIEHILAPAQLPSSHIQYSELVSFRNNLQNSRDRLGQNGNTIASLVQELMTGEPFCVYREEVQSAKEAGRTRPFVIASDTAYIELNQEDLTEELVARMARCFT
ncbi:hypothetical protein GGX14DRAFT_557598 [Mycena pura]|uniref:Uncharacterized protein n=1 Tax=Mycena pura TaxID=153505 RepID=A0AAD6YLF7_9AGAR|nr:hypothetical protein GGX14DRAFT_557598 [Mycena pura]